MSCSGTKSQVLADQILQFTKSLQGSCCRGHITRHEITEALHLLDLQGEASSVAELGVDRKMQEEFPKILEESQKILEDSEII